MVHSEVVTGNVEMVLLGFIGQTYCNLRCRMASAPLSRSDRVAGIYRLKYLVGASGSGVFHFAVNK